MDDVNVQSVDVEFTLPEDRIPELRRTLNAAAQMRLEGVTHDVPLTIAGEFTDLRDRDSKGPDGFRPFNAVDHMQKLDQLQQRIASQAYQREQLKVYGEHFAQQYQPAISRWPAMRPHPAPNPATLPFPYAGVEGVLTPRYKPPPTRKVDHFQLEEVNERWEDLHGRGSRITPVAPNLLFAKDGFDMNLQCLQTDIHRIEGSIKELGRAADVKKLEQEMHDRIRNRTVPHAVSRRLFDVELTVQEKQRLLEELEWNKRLEEEEQFWVERENRNRYYHEMYAGKKGAHKTTSKPDDLDKSKRKAQIQYLEKDFFDDLRQGRANFDVEITRIWVSVSPSAPSDDERFYRSICGPYEWMGSYGTERRGMVYIKQGDKKDGKPRIQFDSRDGRWVIKREDGSVACRSLLDGKAESPTEATWNNPDLIVAYQSGAVTTAKRQGEALDLGSAYSQPLPPSRSRQRTTLAEYETRLRKLQIAQDKVEKAEFEQTAKLEEMEEVEPTERNEDSILVELTDEDFDVINARPEAVPAAHASQIDAVQPLASTGYAEAAFLYLYDVVWRDHDEAEINRILREENVVTSYAELDVPENRGQYGFDPAALWEELKVEKLREDYAYDANVLHEQVIDLHRRGKLGSAASVQTVLEFVWATSREAVTGSEGLRRVGLISDIFQKYPYKAFPIYYWAIEAMVALYNQQEPMYREQFARSIFDICGYVARITYDAPCFAVHTRLLAAMAFSVSDTSMVTGTHMAFVLRKYTERRGRSKGNLHTISIEYILQFLMVAQSTRLLRSQIGLLMEVMESFKFVPTLVVRCLLCCASLYELGQAAPSTETNPKSVFPDTHPKQAIVDKLLVPDHMHIRHVVDLCDLYTDDRKVQGAGCKALTAIARVSQDEVRNVVRLGGLRAMLYAAKKFQSSSAASSGLAQIYYMIAVTAPEELASEHLFRACTTIMATRAKEPQIVQTCALAMALCHKLIRQALFAEVQQELPWQKQTLCQFLFVAERYLYDEKTTIALLVLLRVLVEGDVRLFSSGRNPTAALCMKTLDECPVAIPLAMEIFNRLMHDSKHFDTSVVRKCQFLQRIIHLFTTLGPEKNLNAEQTRWLMLTIGNIAICDTRSVDELWREMSPRRVWGYLKLAISRVNVEDSDVVAQSSRAMALLLNTVDPLGRDGPQQLSPVANREQSKRKKQHEGLETEATRLATNRKPVSTGAVTSDHPDLGSEDVETSAML